MSLQKVLPPLFRRFTYALGWFVIELLGISSVALFILLVLSTIYYVYSQITNTDPDKILDMSTRDNNITLRIELFAILTIFMFFVGLMLGFIYQRLFKK